jgi:hypothetical protein
MAKEMRAVLPGPEALSPLIIQKKYRYLAKTHRYLKFFKNSAISLH